MTRTPTTIPTPVPTTVLSVAELIERARLRAIYDVVPRDLTAARRACVAAGLPVLARLDGLQGDYHRAASLGSRRLMSSERVSPRVSVIWARSRVAPMWVGRRSVSARISSG